MKQFSLEYSRGPIRSCEATNVWLRGSETDFVFLGLEIGCPAWLVQSSFPSEFFVIFSQCCLSEGLLLPRLMQVALNQADQTPSSCVRQRLTTQGRKKLEPGKACSPGMKETQEHYSSNATLLSGTEVELSPHSELQLLWAGTGMAEHILVKVSPA